MHIACIDSCNVSNFRLKPYWDFLIRWLKPTAMISQITIFHSRPIYGAGIVPKVRGFSQIIMQAAILLNRKSDDYSSLF